MQIRSAKVIGITYTRIHAQHRQSRVTLSHTHQRTDAGEDGGGLGNAGQALLENGGVQMRQLQQRMVLLGANAATLYKCD